MTTTVLTPLEAPQFFKNISIRAIKDVRALDVDLLFVLQDGQRVIISGGAMKALNDPDSVLVFSDGKLPLARVFQQIDQINVSPEANLTVTSKEITRYNQNNAKIEKARPQEPESDKPVIVEEGPTQPQVTIASSGNAGNTVTPEMTPIKSPDNQQRLADVEINSDQQKSWGVQWPVAAGVLALLAASAGGGGGSAAAAGAAAPTSGAPGAATSGGAASANGDAGQAVITGAAMLGPLNNAVVTIYDRNGNALSNTVRVVDGKYTVTLNNAGYKGAMMVVVKDETPGVADNFADEGGMKLADLGALPLRALVVANGVNQTVNVTALTELATLKAGLAAGVTDLSPYAKVSDEQIQKINDAVGGFFKVDLLASQVVPTAIQNARGQVVDNPAFTNGISIEAQNYGTALKAIANLVQLDGTAYPNQMVAIQKMADNLQLAGPGKDVLKWATNAAGQALAASSKMQGSLFAESLTQIINDPQSTPEAVALARARFDSLQNLPNGSTVADYLMKNHVAIANPDIYIKQAVMSNPALWQNAPPNGTLALDQGDFLDGGLEVKTPPLSTVKVIFLGKDTQGQELSIVMPSSQADANGQALIVADQAAADNLLLLDPSEPVTAQVTVSDGYNSRTNYGVWKDTADVRVDLSTPPGMTRFASPTLTLVRDTRYNGDHGDDPLPVPHAGGEADRITRDGSVGVLLNKALAGNERLQFTVATAADSDGKPVYGPWKEAARLLASAPDAAGQVSYVAEEVVQTNGQNWVKARVVLVGNQYTGGYGNANTLVTPLQFVLDTVAPAQIGLQMGNGRDDGLSGSDGISRQPGTALSLAGVAELDTELHFLLQPGDGTDARTLQLGNGAAAPQPVQPGQWYRLNSGDSLLLAGDTLAANGKASLVLRQTDTAGNFSETHQTFVIDSTGLIEQAVMLANLQKTVNAAQLAVNQARAAFAAADAAAKVTSQAALVAAQGVLGTAQSALDNGLAQARSALLNADGSTRLDAIMGNPIQHAYIPAIANALAASADRSRVDDAHGVQNVVNAAIRAADAAVAKASVYGDDPGNPAPTLEDFNAMGVLGIKSDAALAAINDALRVLPHDQSNSITLIQATADGYNKLLALADGKPGNTSDAALPGVADYAAIGVTPALSPTAARILGQVIDGKSAAEVATVAQISALALAAQRVAQQAALPVGQNLPQPLTVDDFLALGISGVSADNVSDVASGLNSVPQVLRDNGSVVGPVDSLSEIRSVVAVNIGSLQVMINYAQGITPIDPTRPAQLTPIPANYLTNILMGTPTTRVDDSNVAGINSVILAVGPDAIHSWRKLAALVQSYDLILALADGVSGNGVQQPGADDWERVGVLALKTHFPDAGDAVAKANALALLNQSLDASRAERITGVAKLQELAASAAKVVQLTRDAHTVISAAELNSLGLGLTLNDGQMPVVLSGIAGSGNDGSGVRTLTTLTDVAQRALTAFERIVAHAADNTKPAPVASDFRDLGIKGVTDDAHVNALNSALSANAAAAHPVSTPQQVQVIADAYAEVLAKLADAGGQQPNPPLGDYVSIGTLAPRGSEAIALLDSALVGKSLAQVGTVGALNQLVASANAVNALAAGDTSGLSGTDLAAQYADLKSKLTILGVNGVDDGSMSAVFNAIQASADDGSEVDSVAKLQAVVDVARVAQVRINAYADDATQPAPTLADYGAIGVKRVSAANLDAINSALASAPVTSAQTTSAPLVQGIVDAYAAILAAADGVVGNLRAAPTAAQYALVGMAPTLVTALQPGSDGRDPALLVMLNTLVDTRPATAVASVDALNELGQIAQHILAQAKGHPGDTLLTQDELTKAGITGLDSHTFPAVLSALAASADDGSGVIGSLPGGRLRLQALADNASAAQFKIERYADGVAGALPPQASDYRSVGVDLTALVPHAPLDTAVRAINSVLQMPAIGAAQVNLPTALADIVSAYDVILAAAHGAAPADGSISAQAQLVNADLLARLGIQGLNSSDAATQQRMLSDFQMVLDAMTPAQAGMAARLQASVNAIAQLSRLADGTSGNAADADRFADPLAGLQAAGVTAPDATMAVAALNAIDGLPFAQIATPSSLQRVVDAYARILTEANEPEPIPGTDYLNEDRIPAAASAAHPGAADFSAIGATIAGLTQDQGSAADQAARLSLMDDILKRKARSQVSKVADLNQIGQAVDHLIVAASQPPGAAHAPLADAQLRQWVDDFHVMGVTGVDAGADGNLDLILARLDGIGAEQARTVAQIQALVNDVNRALLVIQNYAADSNRNPAPSVADYQNAGIVGAASVTADNLGFINAVIAGLQRSDVDTRSKVFAIVHAAQAILAAADGEAANHSGAALTPEQYLTLGVPLSSPAIGMGSLLRTSDGTLHLTGVDADKIALLNSIVGAASRDAVASPARLSAMAATAADLIRLAREDNTDPVIGSASSSLSVASLQAIGLRAIASDASRTAFLDAVKYMGNQVVAGTNPPQPSDAASTHDVSGVNGIDKLSRIASSVAKVVAYVNGAGTPADAPARSDYLKIGVSLPAGSPATDASALALLNNVVHGQTDAARAVTIGQLNQFALYVDQIMQLASVAPLAGSNPARYPAVVSGLTPASMTTLGLKGVTSASLPALLNKVQTTADDGSGATSLAALQTMSDAAAAAQRRITLYAQTNTGDAPTAADFDALALPLPVDATGSSAAYLSAINDALKSAAIDGSKVQTPAQLQALMIAAQRVMDAANGVAGDAAPRPVADDFLALGLDKRKLDSAGAKGLGILVDVIDASTPALLGKDSQGRPIALPDKLAELLNVIQAVTAPGALPSPPPDAKALGALGISFAAVAHNADGSVQNWPAILAAIASSKRDGAPIDSLAKLQALVNRADASFTLIRKYADDSNQPAPTAQDYANVGVSLPVDPPAVGSDILNAVNQALASVPVTQAQVGSPALLQGIVDTQTRLLGMADGHANTAAVKLPTLTDYLRVGLDPALPARLSTSSRLALLNGLVDEAVSPAAVDNPAALNTLAKVAAKVQDLVLQRPGQAIAADAVLSEADFATLGMAGLSAAERAAIMSALQGRLATAVETPAQFRSVAQSAKAAMDKIIQYADSNAGDEPGVAAYQALGVSGVSSTGPSANWHPVNAALASDRVTGASVSSPQAIQELVNSYVKLIAQADGTPANTAPAALAGAADFTRIGVDLSSLAALDNTAAGATANAVQLLSSLIDRRTVAEIATPAKIQALVGLAAKVALTVQGNSANALSVSDFADMRLDGVNNANLAKVLAQLARQNANGSDTNTWSKLADMIFSVTNVPTMNPVTGDDVINQAERNAGVILTGTAGRDDSVTLFYPDGTVMKRDIVTQDPGNGTSVWKWSYALSAADWQALGADRADGASMELSVQSHNRIKGVDSVKVAHSITIDTIAPSYADRLALNQDTGILATDGITSDGKILVPASEAGASWSYQIDGAAVQRGTGNSITVSGEGRHTVKVRQTDGAGNAGAEQSLNFTLDTVAPGALTLALRNDTGSSASDKLTKDGTLDVSGLENGASWQFSLDNGNSWSNGSGNSLRIAGAAEGAGNTDGLKNVVARQTDVAGNVGATSAALSFTLDTSLPAKPTLSLKNDTGSTNNDLLSNDGTVVVGGLTAGASWQYSTDGGVSWSNGSGDSYRVPGASSGGSNTDGAKSVLARQINAAGNIGPTSDALAFTLKTILPAAPTVALHQDTGASGTDQVTSDGSVDVSGLSAGCTWQYSLDGGTTWVAGSGSAVRIPAAIDGNGNSDGLKKLQVRQIDAAGNTSTSSTLLSFTLDSTAPGKLTASLSKDNGSSATDNLTNDGTVNIAGLEADASWQYSLDGGTTWVNGSGSSVKVNGAAAGSSYVDGVKTVLLRQTDVAGNRGPNSDAFSFTLDTVAPLKPALALAVDSGSSASDAITNNGTLNISGVEPNARWQYSTDGGTSWSAGSNAGVTLSTEGKLNVVARQIDAAGNASATSDSVAFVLDRHADAPSIALANPVGSAADGAGITSSGSFQLSGVAEKGAKLTVRRSDGSVLASLTASSTDGSWSTNVASTLTVSGLVKLNGSSSSANGSYALLSASDAAALAGSFSNDFASPGRPALDLSKPVYRMSSSGNTWYVWAVQDAGYVISRPSGSDEWYREKAYAGAGALRPEAVGQWSVADRAARVIETEMARNAGRSAHEKTLPRVAVSSLDAQRDSAWEYSVEQTDLAGNTSAKGTVKVLIATVTPPQVDLDPATDGIQTHALSYYSVSDLIAGVPFDASISAPIKTNTHFIDVVFSGPALNAANGHVQLDAPVPLNVDLEKVSGKTVGGVPNVSYAYTATSRTLTMSKSNGSDFSAAEVKALLEAVELQNPAAQPGVRTMQVSLRDAAQLSGPVSEASVAVFSDGLFLDADPNASGHQMHSQRFVSDPAKWNAGVAFDDHVGIPGSNSIAALQVKLGGAGLDLANDKLVLDSRIDLNSNLATVSGKTVGGVSGVSYGYDSASRTLTLSMSSGAPISGAQVQSLVQAVRIGGAGLQDGVRTAQFNAVTTTGEVGPPLLASLAVDNVGPWLDMDADSIGVQGITSVALGSATTKAGGKLFPTDVVVMGGDDIASIRIQLSGPQLDLANDKLVLDVPLSLNASLATAAGKQVGGVGGLSYGYDGSSRTLTLSKSSGAPLLALETGAILDALRLQNATPGDGTRVATITLTDQSGKSSISTANLNVDVSLPPAISGVLLPSTMTGYRSITLPDNFGPTNPHNLSKGESFDMTSLIPTGMTPSAFVASISAIYTEWGGLGITSNANTTSGDYPTYFTPPAPLTLGNTFSLMHQGATAVKGEIFTFTSPDGRRLLLNDVGGYVALDTDVYASNGTGTSSSYDIGNIRMLYQVKTANPDTRPAFEVTYDGARAAIGDVINLYDQGQVVGSKTLAAGDVGAGSKTVRVQVTTPLMEEMALITPQYQDVAGNTVSGSGIPVALSVPTGVPVLSALKVAERNGQPRDLNASHTDYAQADDGALVFSGTVGGGAPGDTYLVSVMAGGKVLAFNTVAAGNFTLPTADRVLAPGFYDDLSISAINMGRGASNGQTAIVANQTLGWYWPAQASDNVSGADGNDVIMLGGMRNGSNTLVQTGLGEDTLVLQPAGVSDPGKLAATITDFALGMDKIRVSGQNISAANLNQYVRASAASDTATRLVIDLDGAGPGTQVYTLTLQNTPYKPEIVPTLFGL